MANTAKQRKAPGKFRKKGESFAISANKEKMARESGRLATVRVLPMSAILPNTQLVGSAKFQRLEKRKSGKK